MRNLFYLLFIALLSASCNIESSSKVRFELLGSETTGIEFNNVIEETDSFNILKNEYMYNGGGVGIADLNNDGLQDVVLTGNKVRSGIYLNEGNFQFRDISSNFKGLSNDQWISGVSVVDIDSDGNLDLYFTATTSKDPDLRKNQLWINQGTGDGDPVFINQAEAYAVADTGHSVHSVFFDYDLDGDLDLYVLNNTVNKDVPTNYREKMLDGSSLNNDSFYRNNGDGTFTDVTRETGILIEGFGLGLAVSDINKDGYPDVYVSNDYISNDLMYINQGDGTFRNSIADYVSYQSKFSMGNDISDINNDGNPDIMTLDMMPKEYFRKKQTINGNSYFFYVNDEKYGYEHQYVRNMVQVHNGFLNGEMIPYSELGQLTGMFDTEWSWSPLFADYDNDGDKDVIITNGFPRDLTDKDFTNYKAQMYNYLATEQQILARVPEVKVSNFVYENTGNLKFVEVTEDWGMKIPSYSNGASYVDLDNDGDLDYIVNNINDQAFIYRNNSDQINGEESHYLKILLEGEGVNNLAIGAKVELWNNGKITFHEHYLTRGYISSVEPVIHFGLNDKVADSLIITWPLGNKRTVLKDIKADQTVTAFEKDAVEWVKPVASNEHYMFSKDDEALVYTHEQSDFIDFFQYQNIMPHKFSQIGPSMAKGDLNGDGMEDILLGASDRTPATVFIKTPDGFDLAELNGLSGHRKRLEADLAIIDIDGDGDQDVVSIGGGYINQEPEAYTHLAYINEGGEFREEQLDIPPFIGSVARPFDFDHDGDMDLFIGSRVKKFEFPNALPSYLLINHDGVFETTEWGTMDLGMVTDATWSDLDGDGWEDLMITREWNSVALLKNENGTRLSEIDNSTLSGKHGAWYSISAGDLDGDGDDDYIVGNLGLNHRFNVSEEYPMHLYAVDIDENGTLDPVTTAFWKDADGVMKEYPVNYYDELVAQSPFFRKRFKTYTEFSFGTADDIFAPEMVNGENKFEINTTSNYILWNEDDGLRWEALPRSAQISPIKKTLIRDLDGDGNTDIILTGNDHSYDVSTGYYDANKGLILMGKGNGEFDVKTPSETGLLINGQVEGLLYFEGQHPLLVAVINRDKAVAFRHNK